MSHDLSIQYICRSYFLRCTSWTRASRVWLEHLATQAQYTLGMWGELPDLSERSENPDPAHGGSPSDLPELPELPGVGAPRTGIPEAMMLSCGSKRLRILSRTAETLTWYVVHL